MKRAILLSAVILAASCAPAPNLATFTPKEFIDTGIDPSSWVEVPAGAFPSGQHDHPVSLDYGYQIMVTDVTNLQYADYLTEALAAGTISLADVDVIENENITSRYGAAGYYPGDPYDGYEHEDRIIAGTKLYYPLEGSGERISYQNGLFSVAEVYQNHPATMVSWFGAEAFCNYYGWRLPSELEWEKAARGPEMIAGRGLAFPWGNEIRPNHANYYSSYDLYEKIAGKLGGTTPVGLYNGKSYAGFQTLDQASPYGLYDMAGNVWQWTGDDYPDQHYRYLRGGSFYSYEVDLRVWKRNSAGPTYFAPDVGFRCARDK